MQRGVQLCVAATGFLMLAACDGRGGADRAPDYRDGLPSAAQQAEILAAVETGEAGAAVGDAETEAPASRYETIDWEEAVAGTPFADWLNRAGAQGIDLEVDGVALRFDGAGDLTWVIRDFEPRAGETYRVELNLAALGGSSPEVRMMLSRDCSSGGEDLGQTIVRPGAEAERVAVEHTFAESHGCQKLVIQVLNASAETPRLMSLANPAVYRVEE